MIGYDGKAKQIVEEIPHELRQDVMTLLYKDIIREDIRGFIVDKEDTYGLTDKDIDNLANTITDNYCQYYGIEVSGKAYWDNIEKCIKAEMYKDAEVEAILE